MNSTRARHAATASAIVALAVALYAGALQAPFVFDDYPNIVKNPYIQRLDGLFDASFDDWIAVALKSPSSRPIANLSFALNHATGGTLAGYHAVNIAIHALNGLLVYALGLALFDPSRARGRPPDGPAPSTRTWLAASFAAAIFVCHPVQVQSVTYIVQRMNSLATFFYLSALLSYIYARAESRPGPRFWRLLASLCCWLLALGSKQTAITLPAALFLYEFYFVQNLSRRWLRRSVPYLVAAATFALLILATNIGVLNLDSYADRDFTMGERLLTQLRVVVFYISLLLLPLPSRLNLSHGFPISHGWLDPATTLLSFIAICGALALAAALARRLPLISFGILWFFLHLLLESSLLPLEMMFEHRLYLPMVGFGLIAADTLARLAESLPARMPAARIATALGVALIAALSVGTLERNVTWNDPALLWADVVAKNPGDDRAQFNFGVALTQQGRHWEAIQHHTESLRLNPKNAKAHNGLGVALAGTGRYREAVKHFADSLRLDPSDPETRSNIALALTRMGAAGAEPDTGAEPRPDTAR